MAAISILRDRFKKVVSNASGWAELRYHKKKSHVIGMLKGELSDFSSKQYEGAGIRVLVDGTFGFASTSDVSEDGLKKALKSAESMAKSLASIKKKKIKLADPKGFKAVGDFSLPGFDELEKKSFEEKFALVKESEEKLRTTGQRVESASCQYSEVFEEKLIITTDGIDAHTKLVRPEFRLSAFATDGTKKTRGFNSLGVTGGWDCLFRNHSVAELIEDAGRNATTLLTAPTAKGGKSKVILSPAMVGLLSHEAIGHTVEADFVMAGSVASQMLNKEVASPLVTMADSGISEYVQGAGGTVLVDDEGIKARKVEIIKDGKLVNYLHNRESSEHFGVEPGGNARAWEFSDEPLIRMRNTYIQPGHSSLDEMISEIDEGFFIDGPEGGQADATGEFMFGASKVREIKKGKLGQSVQNVTVAGQAFEVLKSVDAVSKDFAWDLGAGHCGKGQPAKVDAGGPYLRCEILVGGKQ